jgi:catechol 2,3-dioxygenase-like lactoylglutathione lyase family enzyme
MDEMFSNTRPGKIMNTEAPISTESLTPILYVRDFKEAMDYYTGKLLFKRLWDWGVPPTFGAVRLGQVEVFFCEGAQGHPGTWNMIFIDDVDDYFERISRLGAEVVFGPQDQPWGMREIHVRDPNQHIIRFGQGIPSREPKIEIERVAIDARVEKRLAALTSDLAQQRRMSVGELLEEVLLHSFERLSQGGVASPHTAKTLGQIQHLKQKHGIDYDCHANYRFVEKAAPGSTGRAGQG